VNHYWHLFDQALLRPELAAGFDPSRLIIAKSVGGVSLVTADLWGEIVPEAVRTPLAVLREQAALLGPKTKNLIEATVTTSRDRFQDEFVHHFNLVVPTLDDYTYELFTVTHGITLYPVVIPGGFSTLARPLRSEEEFIGWLRQELSSPKTKGIISNLLAQANS